METIFKSVNSLKPFPRNEEFFDDISGEKWDEFLESIKTLGVIEPLIISQDDVVVSGHQRVKACKELGIMEVPCVRRAYADNDAILLDLIETNIRQRGNVGGSAQKIGKRIKELERLYGVRQGSAGSTKSGSRTRTEIAEEMGISKDTYDKYKSLANMVPELSEAVDTGRVTQSSALAMMKQLTEDEQLELLSGLDATKKYTQKEMADLLAENEELKNRPPKMIEVFPDDYDELKEEAESAKESAVGYLADYRRIRQAWEEKKAECETLENKLKTIEEADSVNAKKKHQIDTCAMFDVKVKTFIEDVAGYLWLADEIMDLPEKDRITFIKAVGNLRDWTTQMATRIKENMEEK